MARTDTIVLGGLSATVDAVGAELTSLALDGTEYLWQADPAWWGRHAPVLFPIVGTLRDDSATSAAGTCRMGRHGLARSIEHELVSCTGSSLTYRLDASAQTFSAYPYRFRLEMTYALEAPATLSQTFCVTNAGEREMPFCLGGHPAFNVPVVAGEHFEDYELRFARPWVADSPVLGPDGLLDYGRQVRVVDGLGALPLTHELFVHDALVLEGVPGDTVTLAGPSGHGVRVDFAGFDHLGVWSAQPSTDGRPCPFVALEPWCGTATRSDEDDVLEHKQNVIVAAPGQTVERTFRVTLL